MTTRAPVDLALPLIIVHGADSDGLASGALLQDHLGAGEVRFADYHTLGEVFGSALLTDAGRPIHFADLSLRAPAISDDLLLALTEGRAVFGYDHHEIGDPARAHLLTRRLSRFVHAVGERCSARLIVDHLDIKSEHPRLLADAAQGSDYWGSVPAEVEALGRALDRVVRELDRAAIVAALVAGLRDPKRTPWQQDHQLVGVLGDAHARIARRIERLLEPLRRNTTHHESRGVRLACTLAPSAFYPKEGLHALRADCPDVDLHLVFYEETTATLAALSAHGEARKLPLVPFLTQLGGGGRNGKGGLNYPTPHSMANYVGRREVFLQALETDDFAG